MRQHQQQTFLSASHQGEKKTAISLQKKTYRNSFAETNPSFFFTKKTCLLFIVHSELKFSNNNAPIFTKVLSSRKWKTNNKKNPKNRAISPLILFLASFGRFSSTGVQKHQSNYRPKKCDLASFSFSFWGAPWAHAHASSCRCGAVCLARLHEQPFRAVAGGTAATSSAPYTPLPIFLSCFPCST
jgi:hypothetical protein